MSPDRDGAWIGEQQVGEALARSSGSPHTPRASVGLQWFALPATFVFVFVFVALALAELIQGVTN